MSAPPVNWTIKALTEWTTKFFASKGIDTPLKEARTIMAHVLRCKTIDVVARSEEEPTPEERTQFKALIQRRADGCPTAYITGTRDFYLLAFEVNPAVLIPRPDTEMLILAAADALKSHPNPRILDLGTGSGCIAVSLAHQTKTSQITAIDISVEALEVARRNAETHHVSNRIAFLQGDLFAPLPAEAKFELIVSNPPYIAPAEIETLSHEVKDYEPRLALDGGPDGLDFYRRIAATANAFLAPGGTVLVEIGHNQGDAVPTLFREAGYADVKLKKDLSQRPRVVVARR
ncbi:MAG: peptide chain release factor N(5)-glutamine methyltransferase [Fimbriiglobus sp.]